MHRELGKKIVERMVEDIKEYGVAEGYPSMEGRTMFVLFNPISDKGLKKE